MRIFLVIFTFLLLLISCSDDDGPEPMDPGRDLTHISYNPTPYEIDIPFGFPQMQIPQDNPMTMEGVQLGRDLFYDPILSADSSMSCFSCHDPSGNFTDNEATSEGIDGITGKRSSMAILDLGFNQNGFFWDGRSATLEEQALLPVEDPIELHDEWPNVEKKLQRHGVYPESFRKAFGIENSTEITKELAAKAIAQFERSLVSSGNAKFDRVMRGETFFTDDELNGFDMFFDTTPELPDAECGHCHNAPLFTINEYRNNGLTASDDLNGFPDPGRGEVTGKPFDNGMFRIPTLRNITLSAPYMHDGRFETLEEVLEHYNSGGHFAPNVDPLIRPLGLTEQQKQQILAFLETLTDTTYVNDPAVQNPF